MAAYAIFHPEHSGSEELLDNPRRMRVVRDGLNFWAFAFPLIWVLFKRMWFAALILALLIVCAFVASAMGGGLVVGVLAFAVRFFMLLEGNQLYGQSLSGAGYRCIDIISASSESDALFLHLNALKNNKSAVTNQTISNYKKLKPAPAASHAGLMLFDDDPLSGARS